MPAQDLRKKLPSGVFPMDDEARKKLSRNTILPLRDNLFYVRNTISGIHMMTITKYGNFKHLLALNPIFPNFVHTKNTTLFMLIRL